MNEKLIMLEYPEYTSEQAAEQLRRLRVPESHMRSRIGNALHDFNRFLREATA